MTRCLLLLLLLASPAWATDYYVDAVAGSETIGTGTSFAPFKQISKAARLNLQPGDTVHVAPGVYNEQVIIKPSGSSSSPLTFVCDQSRQCKVIGQNYASTNSYGRATFVLVGDFINVSGFDITTDANGTSGILGYGSRGGYTLSNNFIHDIPLRGCDYNGGAAIASEATGAGGHSYIAQNVITKIGFASKCGRANGIYLAGNGTTAVNNLIHDSWGSGFDVAHKASDTVVAFNTVDRIWRGNGVGGDGVYLSCDTKQCDNNKVVNNILTNNENAGIESHQGTTRIPAPNSLFSNNLIYGNATACLFPEPRAKRSLGCVRNLVASPNFVAPWTGDYHLKQCSPAIGRASTDEVPNMDLDGNPRPQRDRMTHDIGAYSYTGPECKGRKSAAAKSN